MGLPVDEYKNFLKKWNNHLKRCIQVGGEYFQVQTKKN